MSSIPASQFRQALVSKIEDRAPNAGTAAPLVDFRTLLDLIVEVLKDGRLTEADFEPVAVVCEEAFEEFVRPFDIPGIGPLAEKFVDDLLKAQIRPLLMTLFQRMAVPPAR
jgi:hypothetical protein